MIQRQTTNLTRTIALLAMAFLLVFGSGTGTAVHAQGQATIQMKVEAGVGGFCRQLGWIPVRVQVENTGQDLEAEVRVTVKDGVNTLAYLSRVSLPSSSRKQVTLYVKATSSSYQALSTSLIDGQKTLSSTTSKLNCQPPQTLFVGTILDAGRELKGLTNMPILAGTVRYSELRLDELPERAEGWNALDALVLSGVDTGALNREQRGALREWVTRGGRLLVIGGPKWQAVGAGIEDLLPIQAQGTAQVDGLSALSHYLRAPDPLDGGTTLSVGTLREGANVLTAQNGVPLLVEGRLGFGKVFYLAADPDLQPLADWNGMQDLYGALLTPKFSQPNWQVPYWDTYQADEALSMFEGLEVPSVLYIICWMVFYILLVGPVSYLVLKRMKRNHLAWVTAPGLAIAFTVIAYTAGGLYRGASPILNRLAVVQAWEGQDQAQVRALVGLYSPNRATYTLQADDNLLLSPLDNTASWTQVQDARGSQITEVRLEASGMKSFVAEGLTAALPISHDLVVQVSDKRPTLTGTVTNNSQVTLKDVSVFSQGYFRRLGELGPGKTIKVNLLMENGARSALDGVAASYITGIPSNSEEIADLRRMSFLQTLLPSSGYSIANGIAYDTGINANWGVYLMGWIDEPVASTSLTGKSARTIDTTLYVLSLTPTVEFSGGPWRITNGLFAWEASNPNVSPWGDTPFSSGQYELRFRPAIPLHYGSVESLSLQLDYSNFSYKTNVQVWDFAASQWFEINDAQEGRLDLPDPDRFLGPGSEIRLRMSGDTDYAEVLKSHFTLVVRP